MKTRALGLLFSVTIVTCVGQAMKNVAEPSHYLKPNSQQSDTAVSIKHDSASYAQLLRSKYMSYLKPVSREFQSSSSILLKKRNSEVYKVSPITFQRPKVIHTLLYTPARDMPTSINIGPRSRRPDTPYFLRADRYDWMIYRGK